MVARVTHTYKTGVFMPSIGLEERIFKYQMSLKKFRNVGNLGLYSEY
jgi:hypothetical protein